MISLSPSQIDLVGIPAGSYLMGGVPEDKFVTAVELPRHEEVIAAFELAKTPVTCAQWRDVMGEGESSDLPVVSVSFDQIQTFLAVLGEGYRLPSEAEWEYACRSGGESLFSHGNDLKVEDANFFYDEFGNEVGRGATLPVGSYSENAFGVQDMTGNVCEWTSDEWRPGYESRAVSGRRVIRGGAWDHLPRVLRASWRDWAPEDARWDNLGFRVARSI